MVQREKDLRDEDKNYGSNLKLLNNLSSLDLYYRFPVQFYPELIQSRLKNDYYRSVEAVKHDIMVMLSNAQDFFTTAKNSQQFGMIRRISDWFRRKLDRL